VGKYVGNHVSSGAVFEGDVTRGDGFSNEVEVNVDVFGAATVRPWKVETFESRMAPHQRLAGWSVVRVNR